MKQFQVVSQLVDDLAAITATKYRACRPRVWIDSLDTCGAAHFAGVPHLHRAHFHLETGLYSMTYGSEAVHTDA